MRRKQCEITDRRQIKEILNSCTIGRLATRGDDGYPYITPVNFVWNKGCVYFHSSPRGEKLDNIQRDPRVCFEVDIPLSYLDLESNEKADPCRLHQLYHCVIIRGRATVVKGEEEKARLLNTLIKSHEPGRGFAPVTIETPALAACALIQITPEQVTAKSDLLQGEKSGLVDGVCEFLSHRGQGVDAETVVAIREACRRP